MASKNVLTLAVFNGDGKLDAVVAGEATYVSLGNGDGTSKPPVITYDFGLDELQFTIPANYPGNLTSRPRALTTKPRPTDDCSW